MKKYILTVRRVTHTVLSSVSCHHLFYLLQQLCHLATIALVILYNMIPVLTFLYNPLQSFSFSLDVLLNGCVSQTVPTSEQYYSVTPDSLTQKLKVFQRCSSVCLCE